MALQAWKTELNRTFDVVSLKDRLKTDPRLEQRLRMRGMLLQSIREHFNQDGFLEVQTPSLCATGDPALHLDSFKSELKWSNHRRILWMPTSPEHHMKRMVASGLGNIYQICRFYRNGELGPEHQPEFTGLEWYEVGASVSDTMERTERLVRKVSRDLLGNEPEIERNGYKVNFERPFNRISMREALSEFAGIRVPTDWATDVLRERVQQAGLNPSESDSFDDLINRAVVGRLEPAFSKMGSPVFLTGFPAPMAAMARLDQQDPHIAERFELYAGGLELCNGYGELTDPVEQRERFDKQLRKRLALSMPTPEMDEAFLTSLEQGMADCSGNAMGIDRLLMLLSGADTIQEVTAFPIENELGWGMGDY